MEQEALRGDMKEKGLSLDSRSHRHVYKTDKNFLVCEICGKRILKLEQTNEDDLLIGEKRNGVKYTVRKDRHRYFFPREWEEFIKLVKNREHRFFFLTCLHTGGRIMEVLNLRYKDIDLERGTVIFSMVKQRKARKNFYASGKTRGFFVASNYLSEVKSFMRGKKINPEDYIFLDNSKLPDNYSKLENSERKKYWNSRAVSYSAMFKRFLKKVIINNKQIDWYNFSPHNIRKTYGMWMRTFNKEMAELCYRMGHDINTYLAYYGSSLIFTDDERRKIVKIMGDVR